MARFAEHLALAAFELLALMGGNPNIISGS
jgi:hypothetical protein